MNVYIQVEKNIIFFLAHKIFSNNVHEFVFKIDINAYIYMKFE